MGLVLMRAMVSGVGGRNTKVHEQPEFSNHGPNSRWPVGCQRGKGPCICPQPRRAPARRPTTHGHRQAPFPRPRPGHNRPPSAINTAALRSHGVAGSGALPSAAGQERSNTPVRIRTNGEVHPTPGTPSGGASHNAAPAATNLRPRRRHGAPPTRGRVPNAALVAPHHPPSLYQPAYRFH